ncbi:hypothetical protein D6C78_11065, partial [Aureobasidium pullulans]
MVEVIHVITPQTTPALILGLIGYLLGNSTESDGTYLVSKANGSVIYVQIQYRLGALGFLASSEIMSNGTANAGFLDQRSALQWVQRNIAAFGGDPTKVTIIGGSAGGGSVTAQLMLNGGTSDPPFRAAIANFPWWQTFHNQTLYDLQYRNVLRTTGCGDLSCLRALPLQSLATALNQTFFSDYQKGYFGYGDFYYGPAVDGNIIRGLPSVEFGAGKFSKVPIMVDHDALEGLAFTNFSVSTFPELVSDVKTLWPAWTPSFLSQLDSLYDSNTLLSWLSKFLSGTPLTTNLLADLISTYVSGVISSYNLIEQNLSGNGPFAQLSSIFGDAFVNCGTWTLANSFVKQRVPVWKAIYNSGILVHTAWDVTLLESVNGLTNYTQQAIVQDYVLSFVRDLDPNTVNTVSTSVQKPQWMQYGSTKNILQFNYTTTNN